ncbi:hypothetical protein Hdeb2414_s0119g00802471 [Helianthus debilis subsp. tardiflorus]
MQYCVDHPEEISKLSKVKARVSEVKGVMMENIEKMRLLFDIFGTMQPKKSLITVQLLKTLTKMMVKLLLIKCSFLYTKSVSDLLVTFSMIRREETIYARGTG